MTRCRVKGGVLPKDYLDIYALKIPEQSAEQSERKEDQGKAFEKDIFQAIDCQLANALQRKYSDCPEIHCVQGQIVEAGKKTRITDIDVLVMVGHNAVFLECKSGKASSIETDLDMIIENKVSLMAHGGFTTPYAKTVIVLQASILDVFNINEKANKKVIRAYQDFGIEFLSGEDIGECPYTGLVETLVARMGCQSWNSALSRKRTMPKELLNLPGWCWF